MHSIPLLQQTLGDDWHTLPTVIQRHYQLSKDSDTSAVVHGSLSVNYPVYVKPILLIVRIMGALIDTKGDAMQVTVQKWISDKSPTLYWRRDIQTSKGKAIVFKSRMVHECDNELIEFVGLGFGIRLRLTAENGHLVYRSNGHLWRCRLFTIPIPDVLFLGHATIIEKPVNEEAFELDFKIVHPLFGRTYSYGGIFRHEKL